MNAKEYLQQLKKLDIQIAQRRDQLEELRLMILSAADPSREHVTGGKKPADAAVVDYISRLEDREKEISEMIAAYLDLKAKIIDEIQSLPNPLHVQILYKRYVEYKKMERIAREMHYGYKYISDLHRNALQNFQKHQEKSGI